MTHALATLASADVQPPTLGRTLLRRCGRHSLAQVIRPPRLLRSPKHGLPSVAGPILPIVDAERMRCAEVALATVEPGYFIVSAADLAAQEQGHSMHKGMHVGWAWGAGERSGPFLDFLSEHRTTGIAADRYFPDGRVEPLPTPTSVRTTMSDVVEDARLEAEFVARNKEAYEYLRDRGLLPAVGENVSSHDINEFLLSDDAPENGSGPQIIPLATLLPAGFDPTQFKVHFAKFNGETYPIDVLANDPDGWQGWNSWRSVNNDFNRQFIFSLAQDRHDLTKWLFGGVWEVMARRPEQQSHSYDVISRDNILGAFAKRLWIRVKIGRNIRRSMETVLDDMIVESLDETAFVGDPFPGHDRIRHTLAELQAVVDQQRPDWRIALEHMKGVYVIHDSETGIPYVGSATSEDAGIWSRWSTYARTLHGGNKGLIALVEERGGDYYRHNMTFALLEFWSMRTDDKLVFERESYWKDVLHARPLGHNKN